MFNYNISPLPYNTKYYYSCKIHGHLTVRYTLIFSILIISHFLLECKKMPESGVLLQPCNSDIVCALFIQATLMNGSY